MVKLTWQGRKALNRAKVSSWEGTSWTTISWGFPGRQLGGSCRLSHWWRTHQPGWRQHRRWPRRRIMPVEGEMEISKFYWFWIFVIGDNFFEWTISLTKSMFWTNWFWSKYFTSFIHLLQCEKLVKQFVKICAISRSFDRFFVWILTIQSFDFTFNLQLFCFVSLIFEIPFKVMSLIMRKYLLIITTSIS